MTPVVHVGSHFLGLAVTVLPRARVILDSMGAGTATADTDGILEVTERAAEEVHHLLEQEGLSPSEAGLRLFVQQGGCAGLSYGLRFDREPESEDAIVTAHDIQVFVDPASLEYVEGSVIDYDGGLQGEGFVVDNPNIVTECGCGESFRT